MLIFIGICCIVILIFMYIVYTALEIRHTDSDAKLDAIIIGVTANQQYLRDNVRQQKEQSKKLDKILESFKLPNSGA